VNATIMTVNIFINFMVEPSILNEEIIRTISGFDISAESLSSLHPC
jgi:hypothetical protein